MIQQVKRHTISFKHAFDGLWWSLKTQPIYKIHFFLSIISLAAAFYLRISYFVFLIILFFISVVFLVETINT
jgi:diacylglycerol kinase (ATP)